MPTTVTPQEREQAREAAIAGIEFVTGIAAAVKRGVKITDALWLAQQMLAVGMAVKPILSGGPDQKAALAGEMLDALTGSDESAIPGTGDFMPGLSMEEEELALDALKPIVEGILATRLI